MEFPGSRKIVSCDYVRRHATVVSQSNIAPAQAGRTHAVGTLKTPQLRTAKTHGWRAWFLDRDNPARVLGLDDRLGMG